MSTRTGRNSSRALRVDRAWGGGRSRWIAVLVATAALALCIAGGAVIDAALAGRPTTVDEMIYRAIAGYRAPWLDGPSLVLNQLGGGNIALFVIPAIAAVALFVTRGAWAALAVLPLRPLTQWAVESLKGVFERPRPPHQEVAVTLSAYPSGHSAVAASLVVVLALVIRHRWFTVIGAAYVVAMGYSRLYLSVHWFTDTVGGTALGIAIGLAMWAAVGGIRSLISRAVR